MRSLDLGTGTPTKGLMRFAAQTAAAVGWRRPTAGAPGCVRLGGLRLAGVHGVHAQERERAQPFVVDLELRLDLAAAGRGDDLTATCDYSRAARVAAEVLAGPPRNLIESLAWEIAGRLLAEFDQLREVRVRVHKPEAPIGLPFADVSAEVRRVR